MRRRARMPGVAATLIAGFVLSWSTHGATAQESLQINARVNYVYAPQFGFGAYTRGRAVRRRLGGSDLPPRSGFPEGLAKERAERPDLAR